MKDRPQIHFSRARMAWMDPVLSGILGWRFRQILVRGECSWRPDALHVLLCQHVGRYDGFVLRRLHKRDAPESRLVTIMLERQLKRYPIFRKAGAIGITPGSVESGKQLKQVVASELRAGDCVGLFPQGRIEAVDADPTLVRTGFRHFQHPHLPTRFIPVALSIEALTHPKPTCFVQVGAAVDVGQAGEAFAGNVHSLREWIRAHGESADGAWDGTRLR